MRGASVYQNNRVVGARPENLVVMLYERLLADLRAAAVAIDDRNYERKAERLQHALDIIFELMATLDAEAGGDLAARLRSLYTFFISEINDVSRTLDTARLHRVIDLVDGLYDSWRQVGDLTDDPSSPAAPLGTVQ